MMNQQPDKLFRDKLQSFQTPAPSGAWNRIEANLDKKNNKVLWFRIAASLLLVAIAAYLLWPANSADITVPQSPLANKTREKQIVQPEQNKENETITPAPVPQNTIARETVAARRPVQTKQNKSVREKIYVEKKEEALIAENENTSVESNETAETSVISIPTERQTVVAAYTEKQKVKIIFSAEDIDNKYLDKKALAEATSDEKKSSTLKKLLDKAYDLKYNQDPFGDLRQKKNEILALNFKTDKQRKEN